MINRISNNSISFKAKSNRIPLGAELKEDTLEISSNNKTQVNSLITPSKKKEYDEQLRQEIKLCKNRIAQLDELIDEKVDKQNIIMKTLISFGDLFFENEEEILELLNIIQEIFNDKNNSFNSIEQARSYLCEALRGFSLRDKNSNQVDLAQRVHINYQNYIKDLINSKEYYRSKIARLVREYDEFDKAYSKGYKFAILLNPCLEHQKAIDELVNSGVIVESEIVEEKISLNALSALRGARLLKYNDYINDNYGLLYYDLTDKTTNEACKKILDNKGRIVDYQELSQEHSIPLEVLEELPLKTIDFEVDSDEKLSFIDLSDDETKKILDEQMQAWNRLKPQKSKYYFSANKIFNEDIPAGYLQKLGFGNIAQIRRLIQAGKLEGKIEKIDTPQGVKYKTNVSRTTKNSLLLRKLRELNPDIVTFSQLAKELKISKKELSKKVAYGQLDIIPEFILPYDNNDKFIFRNTEKNEEFINKTLFENEIKQQLVKLQREQKQLEKVKNKSIQAKLASLKMKLVWHYCTNTRKIASDLAVQDGYLCQLLAKELDDIELNPKEETKVNSYRKTMWQIAGTDELKEGFKKANEILSLYAKGGIDSISDSEVRRIISLYN